MSVSLLSLVPDPTEGAGERTVLAELVAFVLVGGTGALAFVTLSTLVIGVAHGVPSWIASTACYAALITPGYLLHRRFTFRSAAPHGQALPRYAGVQVMLLLVAALFSYVTYGIARMSPVYASVLVSGLTAGVNFAVLRLWAFARRDALAADPELAPASLAADDISV